MAYEIIETSMTGRRNVITTAEDFASAKAKVEAMGVAHMEDDADYPGCADAYMKDNRIVCIQPVGFHL